MDVIGIEIRKDSWEIAHLRKTFKGVSLVKSFTVEGGQRAGELSAYISRSAPKGAITAAALPRRSSISRVLEIPAPDSPALESILGFEIEKHMPVPGEEVLHGFRAIGKKGNTFTVLVEAACVKAAETELEKLSGPMAPVFVGAWQGSFYNALEFGKTLKEGENRGFLRVSGNEAAFALFAGTAPVCSFFVEASGTEALSEKIRKETALAIGALGHEIRIREVRIISETEVDGKLVSWIREKLDSKVELLSGADEGSALLSPAMGAGLCALGLGRFGVRLAPQSPAWRAAPPYSLTLALASAFTLLMFLTGASYFVKDWLSLRELASVISEVKSKGAEARSAGDSLTLVNERLRELKSVDGKGAPGVLDVMRELTELVPGDTWLTGFEYRDGQVFLEGFSANASSFIIGMQGAGLLKDLRFDGPVVKGPDNKERFRIRLEVKGHAGNKRSGNV